MTSSFSIRAVLKESHAIIKPRFWKLVGRYAILACVFLALNSAGDHNLFLSMVLSSLFSLSSVVFAVTYVDGGEFTLKRLLDAVTMRRFVIFFLTTLLADIAIFGGLLLLMLPGIIAAVQLRFVKFIAYEKDLTPMAALKESVRMTKGSRWKIFEFILVSLIINMLGAVCLGVGLFFTVPLTLMAWVIVYRKLAGESVVAEAPADSVSVEAAVA